MIASPVGARATWPHPSKEVLRSAQGHDIQNTEIVLVCTEQQHAKRRRVTEQGIPSHMRLTDARFGRDLLRYRLALGLLRFHARSRAIERWTGLSIYRIRTLREYVSDAPELAVTPLRGVSPHKPAVFFRSAQVRTEGALLAGFLHLFKVTPPGARIENAADVIP